MPRSSTTSPSGPNQLLWLDLERPTAEDLGRLAARFQPPPGGSGGRAARASAAHDLGIRGLLLPRLLPRRAPPGRAGVADEGAEALVSLDHGPLMQIGRAHL